MSDEEEMEQIAEGIADKVVRAYNCHDDLLAACERALPYLRNHIGLTANDGPGDRIALDLCEEAIAKAKPKGEPDAIG
jgi:hypothetical protein